MERNRSRLPRSDSGRLIRSSADPNQERNGRERADRNQRDGGGLCAPGVSFCPRPACRRPRPKAVRVRVSKPSSGSCSAVFGMDIGKDIAYPYTSRFGKGNGKSCDHGGRDSRTRTNMPNPIYALILAGGSGERFWPLSRRARPKQLLRLVSETDAARRNGRAPRRTGSAGTHSDSDECRTGSGCAGIAAEIFRRKILWRNRRNATRRRPLRSERAGSRRATIPRRCSCFRLITSSRTRAAFQKTLTTGGAAAEETGALVTIGIKPTWACPGFGYIEQGEKFNCARRKGEAEIHRVIRFREKPNADLAESFLRKGNFRWNAGMFVWSVPTVLSEFNRHVPELANFISQIRAPGDFEKTLHERFSKLPKISFDYAIMEKRGSRPGGGSGFRLG